MNKSRRMAALQARALARLGGTVALFDPRGTGDSAGEHGDATWDDWRCDVLTAWRWLGERVSVPCLLWGLRLGGLLAADLVARGAIGPAALLLWQPVSSGRLYFNQFLRLAAAQQMTGRSPAGADPKLLRAALQSGASIEITGYDLHPALVAGAEALALSALARPQCPIVWRETTIIEPAVISPAAATVAAAWAGAGAQLDLAAVRGSSFWATQEITEAPELIASTASAMAARFAGDAAGVP